MIYWSIEATTSSFITFQNLSATLELKRTEPCPYQFCTWNYKKGKKRTKIKEQFVTQDIVVGIDAGYFTSTISQELGIYVQFKAIPIRINLQNVPSMSESGFSYVCLFLLDCCHVNSSNVNVCLYDLKVNQRAWNRDTHLSH